MEQLHAFDCHQNVAEPQATENHIKRLDPRVLFSEGTKNSHMDGWTAR